jgi:elongation factor Ts
MSSVNMIAGRAAAVAQLREKTGAGILDCNKALEECNFNLEDAVDFLRKKGLASAAKKAGNIAAEGLVAVKIVGLKGAIIEINSQTDFVARNEQFQDMMRSISEVAIHASDIENLKNTKLSDGAIVSEKIMTNIATIGENLNLRRFQTVVVKAGIVASYVHNHVAENMGSIGVLVALESDLPGEKLGPLGKQIAMHIAAAKPQSLDVSGLDSALVEREKNIVREQSKSSGKPENVIEKMAEGRMRKFYEESVLLEQTFVIDGKTKISDLVANSAKELGGKIQIVDFVKYEVGEGITQKSTSFAEEVAAVAKSS